MQGIVLTPRFVDNAKTAPGQDRVLYFDTHRDAPRGFALRVTSNGARSYYLVATVPSTRRRVWIRIGDAAAISLVDARRAARARAGDVAGGRDPNAEARAAAAHAKAERQRRVIAEGEWTVVELLRRYRTARLDRLSTVTAGEYERMITREFEPSELGPMKARDVVRDDVRRLLARKAKKAPHVAAHLLALLRAAYRWALDEEVMVVTPDGRRELRPRVDRDPTRKVEADLPLPMRAQRERHLSDSEISTWWRGVEQLAPCWSAFGRIILLCGTRRGETYHARWSDFDLDAALWRIPADYRKGRVRGSRGERKALDVPLSPLAVRLLLQVQAISGRREYVFRAQGFSIGMVGDQLKTASGIHDVTIHDLRRSCSSGLQRIAAPPHVISVVLGHAREKGATVSDAAYMHGRRADEHRLWLEKWSAHIERLLGEISATGAVVQFPASAS